jgi:hypothetical protein
MGRTGFGWLRIGFSGGLLFRKKAGFFWQAKWQSAFQIISCTTEWRMAVELNLYKETVTYIERGLTFDPRFGFSTLWQCFNPQGALCQVVSGTKIDYWYGTPTLFPLFDSEWLLAISKNEVWLKGRKFQGTEDIQRNVTTTLKAIREQEFQKFFHQWQHLWAKCLAAQGEYCEGDPSM